MATLLALIVASAIPATAASQADVVYQQAVGALYNLDFSIAEAAFNSLIKQNESNPDYWNGLASTIWLKILFDQQKLNIDSYAGGSIGTSASKNDVNQADEKRLRTTVDTAIQKANALLARKPNDINALYSLGVSHATLAAFEGIARRSYYAALGSAKTARAYHQRVLKLDPNFHDAQLSVGTFDYGVSVIPRFFRFFLGVSGGEGKEAGIRKLQLTAAKGTRASTDAKMILVVFYNREKRYEQSLELINELLMKYPRNFQLEIEKAGVYGKMGKWPQVAETFKHIISKVEARQDGYERLRVERVYFELGKANVHLNLDQAIIALNRVIAGSTSIDEKADATVWLGRIYDSRNERDKALEQYNAVLKMNTNRETKDAALAYIRKPYK